MRNTTAKMNFSGTQSQPSIETNFHLWKHKLQTHVSVQKDFWRYRTVETMLAGRMLYKKDTHGSYRFHIRSSEAKHETVVQILVVNWATFIYNSSDDNAETRETKNRKVDASLDWMRPVAKIHFRDCWSEENNLKYAKTCRCRANLSHRSKEWSEKFEVEVLTYPLQECLELLSVLHQHNNSLPEDYRKFPDGMLCSWLYYLPPS